MLCGSSHSVLTLLPSVRIAERGAIQKDFAEALGRHFEHLDRCVPLCTSLFGCVFDTQSVQVGVSLCMYEVSSFAIARAPLSDATLAQQSVCAAIPGQMMQCSFCVFQCCACEFLLFDPSHELYDTDSLRTYGQKDPASHLSLAFASMCIF